MNMKAKMAVLTFGAVFVLYAPNAFASAIDLGNVCILGVSFSVPNENGTYKANGTYDGAIVGFTAYENENGYWIILSSAYPEWNLTPDETHLSATDYLDSNTPIGTWALTGGTTSVVPCPAPPQDATSTTEQTQSNLGLGVVLFVIGMVIPMWFFKKKN